MPDSKHDRAKFGWSSTTSYLIDGDDSLHVARSGADSSLCGLERTGLVELPALDDGTPNLHGIRADAVCDECLRGGRRSTVIGRRGSYRIEYGNGTVVQVGSPDYVSSWRWYDAAPAVLGAIGLLLALVAVLMSLDVL